MMKMCYLLQLQELHANPDDAAAMPTIERLQQQLQQLQDQVSTQAAALNAAAPQRNTSAIRSLPKSRFLCRSNACNLSTVKPLV